MDVEYLARLDDLHCLAQGLGHRLVVFAAITGRMYDDNTESQFFQVVLEFKAAVECEENIEGSLGQFIKLVVGGALPFGFAYGGDLVSGQEIANARIETFV
jgi:hypothetical protein